tara:strand:+ start:645 stop:761 length:117 start_codon:yes stop_codon:yes gene_type:complete
MQRNKKLEAPRPPISHRKARKERENLYASRENAPCIFL